MVFDIKQLLPMAPDKGPPLPLLLAPYLPWEGYWPWYKGSEAGNGMVSLSLPSSLQEGSTGNTGSVIITNNSVYQGSNTKAPYTFALSIGLYIPSSEILIKSMEPTALAPEQVKNVTFTFDIPMGVFGPGYATAVIYTTDGVTQLGIAQVIVTVLARVITPAGTISW